METKRQQVRLTFEDTTVAKKGIEHLESKAQVCLIFVGASARVSGNECLSAKPIIAKVLIPLPKVFESRCFRP